MKKDIWKRVLWAVILLSSFSSLQAQKKAATADQFLKAALKSSALQKKPVLLLCYGNTNPWSAMVDSIINNKQYHGILSKYYIVKKLKTKEQGWAAKHANLVGNGELFDRFYAKNESPAGAQFTPTLFIIDQSGKKLGQYSGFPENVDDCITTLAKTSAITADEQHIIGTALADAYKRNGPPTASEVLKNAIAQAAATHKKVFLIFHASWCHWCHVLDTAMNEAVCKPFFEKNFVIAHVVAHESNSALIKQNLGADAMLSKYQGSAGNGIPFWVVFDEQGKLLFSYEGFPSPHYTDDYARFEKILKETTGASTEDLAAVNKAFTALSIRNGIHD